MNDAPALATADIGIAMGNGYRCRGETSDIVIMQSDLQSSFLLIRLVRNYRVILGSMVCDVGRCNALNPNFFGLTNIG